MDQSQTIIGRNIQIIRKNKGMTQEVLADLAGVNNANLSKIERGKINLSIQTLEKIAAALDVQPYQLLMPESKVVKEETRLDTRFSRCLAMFDNLTKLKQRLLNSILETFFMEADILKSVGYQEKTLYKLTEEEHYLDEVGKYRSYGIIALSTDSNQVTVSDITTDRKALSDLVDCMNTIQLSRSQIYDVIEDFLCS